MTAWHSGLFLAVWGEPMSDVNELVNPYAASDYEESAFAGVSEHEEYEFGGEWIRSRSGLRLPAYCLLTGDDSELNALPIRVVAFERRLRWVRKLGWALMGAGVLSWPILGGAAALLEHWAGGLSASTSQLVRLCVLFFGLALLLSGAATFFAGTRNQRQCVMLGFQAGVCGRRQLYASLSLLALMVIGLMVFLGGGAALVGAFLAIFPIVALKKFSLPGAFLRAEYDADGVFEIRGIPKAYCVRLREHAEKRLRGAVGSSRESQSD